MVAAKRVGCSIVRADRTARRGCSRPRIGVYQGATLIGRREVSVFITFGRSVPTNQQLRRANAELRRARFG
jgi:hypothetical protein